MTEGPPRESGHHPFGHVQIRPSTVNQAFRALRWCGGAQVALVEAHERHIVGRSCADWSSADIRVLVIYGLVRKVGTRLDGAVYLAATEKGEDVLRLLGEI